VSRVARLVERRRVKRNFSLLWFAQFVNTAGLMMLVPIMPLHMARLGVPEDQVGLWAGVAVAAPALPLAITTPMWGRLGDRVGRNWMVVRALLGLAAAMAVMAAASGATVFVLGRLLQGTVGGVVEAAAAFVAADGDDEEDRGAALGRSFSATAAGSLVGPVAGGLLVGTSSLMYLMIGLAVVATALSAYGAVKLRGDTTAPSTGHTRSRPDNDARWASTIRRIHPPVLVAAFLAYLGVYGLIPVYPGLVEDLVADPRVVGPWVGGLHALMWAGTLLGSAWWGKRNDRRGSPLRTFMWAALLTSAAIAVQAVTPHPLALAPSRFIQGWGFAALAQSVVLHASRSAPPALRGSHVGIANSFLLLGQFAGPLIAGALMMASPSQGVLVVFGATVAAAAVMVRQGATTRWVSVPTLDRVGVKSVN